MKAHLLAGGVIDGGKKQKYIILILAILLAVSVCTLAGLLIYRSATGSPSDSVTVPDNIITPDAEPSDSDGISAPGSTSASDGASVPSGATQPTEASSTSANGGSSGGAKAPVLALHSQNPEDNIPFQAVNMFPGDRETKYYCVQVSYQDKVTVKFHAAVRPGYEKLAEVLKCKITLLTTGETLYDGLMRDMPASLDHPLSSASAVTDSLYYEITAYLDTSVGNEYQNKTLIADFFWWVDETKNLEPPPKTGEQVSLLLWICLCLGSLAAMILLLLFGKRRKEERYHET